jgi:serine/threonine protein kinase
MHRDINLKNFRIDKEGQVKLINYGYVKKILNESQIPIDSSF